MSLNESSVMEGWNSVMELNGGWVSEGDQFSSVAQSCLILCNSMDCSLSGSSLHGILRARVLEWGATAFSRGSSLGREDPLGEAMATHSSILGWRIPKDRGAWWATVHGVTKSWTRLSTAQHHPYNLSLLIASFVEIELQCGLFLSFFICKYYATLF